MATGDKEEKYLTLLQQAERELGANHPVLAYPLTELGDIYQSTGRAAEAEQCYKRSIALWEQQDADNWHMAQPLNNLGILYATQQRFAEAGPLMERALQIEEKHGGENSRLCTPLDSLIYVYHMQGKEDEAEAAHLRVEEIAEKHGSDSAFSRGWYPFGSMTYVSFDMNPYQVADMYHQALKEAKQSIGRADVDGELHTITANRTLNREIAEEAYPYHNELETPTVDLEPEKG